MFDILDLFNVKENVSPNLQLWVDALNHYDDKAINQIAEDVWIIARTMEKLPALGSITQNVLLGALKYAITRHTVENADATVDKELLRLSLRKNIVIITNGAKTMFYINSKSVANLDDIQRCIEALVGDTSEYENERMPFIQVDGWDIGASTHGLSSIKGMKALLEQKMQDDIENAKAGDTDK